jgi:ABC-2 type transport system permease protein
METIIPSTSAAFGALLKADFTTQWRNRRSVILVLLVPVIICISWKGLVDKVGGAFVLSNCITIGLIAIGLMGYSNSIARDRDKGIFQRLRVAPVPSWAIMASRLTVQLAMIVLLTLVVYGAGYYFDHVTLTTSGYVLSFLAALVGGAVYLALGQVIVGRIKNAETVNSTSRLIYLVFIMVGMFAELGVLYKTINDIEKWSPYGTVKSIVMASMQPGAWTEHTTLAFLATIGYAIVFTFLGIKWFKWDSSK